MQEQLELLVQLQEIDDQLLDLKQERGNLPETVEHLKAEIEETTHDLDIKREEHLNAGEERHRIEKEVDTAKISLKKYQDQLFKVSTNREYDAITTEIESEKTIVSNGESQIIELMGQEEDLTSLVSQQESHLEKIKSDFEEQDAELQERIAETSGLEATLHKKRSEIIERLAKPIYAHYERIHMAKDDGMGVSNIFNGACGGCFAAIPPQKLLEISSMSDFLLCETCGRILVDPNALGSE